MKGLIDRCLMCWKAISKDRVREISPRYVTKKGKTGVNKIAGAIFIVLWVACVNGGSSHLSIDAHEVSSGTVDDYQWATSWGSYDKTVYGSKYIEVSVHNMSRTPIKTQITVYFYDIAYREIGKADGEFDLTGKLEAKAVLNVPFTTARELNLAAIGERKVWGTLPPVAWCAVGRIDGQIFGLKASNGAFQDRMDRALRDGKIR